MLRHAALLAGVCLGASAAALAATEQITIDPQQVKTLTSGISGPEGPSELPDGSIAMVEFVAGNIPHVTLDGKRDNLASIGVGAAGTAVGRDGALYVVKLNPAKFMPGPPPGARANPAPTRAPGAAPLPLPASPAAVVRIDLKTRATKTLYSRYQGEELKAPDDLAIDRYGDIWFTDVTANAVYWARTDGSAIRRMITDVPGVNGITLSPDGHTIYIIGNGKLLAYTLSGRGTLAQQDGQARARSIAVLQPNLHAPDGMKTEANGDILLACWGDGILRYSPRGEFISQTKIPGIEIINLGFGGKDERTLYLAAHPQNNMVGGLMAIRWPRPGIKLP